MRTATVRRALALTVLAPVAALALPAGSAFAQTDRAAGDAPSPVVVGPMLQIFTFGDTIGLPLGCGLATSLVITAAAEAGQAQTVLPVTSAGNEACATISAQGAAALEQARTASQPLAALNSTVNPVIQTGADTLRQVGTDYGPELAPFGPTIAGLGDTLEFFEGR